jgi:hypothetical protein
MNRKNIDRVAGGLVRVGTGAFAFGLIIGCGLIGRYFCVTPLSVCSQSLATEGVFEVWPWALPWLAIEGSALLLATLGLCLMVSSTARPLSINLITKGSSHDTV